MSSHSLKFPCYNQALILRDSDPRPSRNGRSQSYGNSNGAGA